MTNASSGCDRGSRLPGMNGRLGRHLQDPDASCPHEREPKAPLVGLGSGPKRTRPYNQRCAVRVMYAKNTDAGQWRAHGRYVGRESATHEGDSKAVGFDGCGEQGGLPRRLPGAHMHMRDLKRLARVEQHTAERLKFLESMGLAEPAGPTTWRVATKPAIARPAGVPRETFLPVSRRDWPKTLCDIALRPGQFDECRLARLAFGGWELRAPWRS
jgi:hypothetical protein